MERFEIGSTTSYLDACRLVFESYLVYPNLAAAMGSNIYRAFKISASQCRHQLRYPHWSPEENHGRMGEIQFLGQLALDICRSVHHHFSDNSEQKINSISALLFSAAVASKALHQQSRKTLWLGQILSRSADTSGVELAQKPIDSVHLAAYSQGNRVKPQKFSTYTT